MTGVAEWQPQHQGGSCDAFQAWLHGAAAAQDQGLAIAGRRRERDFATTVLDTAGALVAVTDREGRIVYFNRFSEQVTGYSSAEVRGHLFWDRFVVQEELEQVRNEFLQLQSGHFPSQHENDWLTKDGSRRRITWSNTVLTDAVGEVEYIIGIGIDVTEQRQAEEALHASEAKLQAVFDLLPIGISILDEQRHIVHDNPALHRILDLPREGLRAGDHAARTYLRPDGERMSFEEYPSVRAVRDHQPAHGQIGVVKEDGTVTWTEVSAVPVCLDDWQVVVTTTDITRRKEAEDALRRTNEELEQWVAARTEELLESNRHLELEIGERRKVEKDLRRSEQELEQRVERRTRELATLLEISNAAALSKELAPFLERILELLDGVVGYDGATVYRLEGDVLKAVLHRGPLPAEDVQKLHLLLERASVAYELLSTQKPVSIPDLRADTPPARAVREVAGERFDALFGYIRSWLGLPLAVKGVVVGLLTLQRRQPGAFDARETELAQALAGQLAVAVENARLYQQAQELAVLQERQRLARELHDAVSQTLFSASLAAEVLPRLWEEDRQSGLECLSEVRQLTRGALAEMRTLLLELRPSALAQADLPALLQQLAEAASSRARIPVAVEADPHCALPADVRVALYRIVQEALNNIVKHAGARRAAITLRCVPPDPPLDAGGPAACVELSVADDGRGYEPAPLEPAGKGLGLGIMRERAEGAGATFAFSSEAGKGTSITVTWPRRNR